MRCYCLHFKAPFHVDNEGTGFLQKSESFIRSDTLSAAIMSTWAMMDPAAVDGWKNSPPYLVSSAFPFFRETFFLPRPHFSRHIMNVGDQFQDYKKIKAVEWVSVALWKETVALWTQSHRILLDMAKEKDKLKLHASLAGLSGDLISKDALWLQEERTRLAIDRSNQQAADNQLFEFARTFFPDGGGLYFFADMDENVQNDFETVLRLLGATGIGADRNVGNGWFEWERHKADFGLVRAKPGEDGLALSLSLVLPSESDMEKTDWLDDDVASYDLINRHGWVLNSSIRKKPLRMFTEGSGFKRALAGSMEKVAEVIGKSPSDRSYSVYRDGRGFFVRGSR